MPIRDWRHAEERAARLIDDRQHYVEGAIIDWLIRTGQWDPQAKDPRLARTSGCGTG